MSSPPSRRTPVRGSAQPHTPPSVERAVALRDVIDHAVRVQREITAVKPIRRSRARRVSALVLSLAALSFSGYSLVARPAFIWGKPVVESASRADASVRFGLYLLAQRLESFRLESGRYPVSLGDIGETVEGVQYTLVSDSVFELRSSTDSTVVLRSDTPLERFLGNSVNVIQGRTP